MSSISVIIPTYNRADMVCRCIRSVLETEHVADLEIIVVDDCSPDDTSKRIAAEFGDRVRCLRNDRNSFQAVSRNTGARVASGEFLFFLDDDNLVDRALFTELMRAFALKPNAGLIAPMAIHQREGQSNLIWSLGSDFNRWTSQPKDRSPNLPLEQLPEDADLLPTTYSPNAFMVRRKVFDEVGGFDETLVQVFEESDLGWKIREHGYEAYIATRARTDHYGFLEPGCVPRLRQLGIEKPYRTFCFARNRLRFARRHFTFLQSLVVTLIFAPLSCLYYGITALRNRRADIARAYLKGTLTGIFGL